MNIMIEVKDTLYIPDAPSILGLIFRGFRGKEDYPAMAAVIEGSKQADQLERTDSVKDIARGYDHLFNCDPYRDMLFAEYNGDVIGYSRVWWQQELADRRRYEQFANLLPEWRGKGIRRAMVRQNERRLREIAAIHRAEGAGAQLFEAWAADTEVH